MNPPTSITPVAVRRRRLEQAVGPVTVSPPVILARPGPMVAVTSSRLGHDVQFQRRVCRYLSRSVLDCRHRGGTLLIAQGSAIEPWALRAAELFAVPLVRLVVGSDRRTEHRADHPGAITARVTGTESLSRDAVVIGLADRVDAVHIRRGGTVERCLRQRLATDRDASTRIAIGHTADKGTAELIAAGAIGWYLVGDTDGEPSAAGIVDAAPGSLTGWTQCDGQWLVHCTRGRRGPWPGESERQFRDAMLLGDAASGSRGPLDALQRIVRSGRLVASAVTSAHQHPVVCFSAQPLAWLLRHRCYRVHVGRWDYEPYGVAIRITAASQAGIQPVIYGGPQQRDQLPPDQRFRFHPLGNRFDWAQEREWRADRSVDLTSLRRGDVRIFAPPSAAAQQALNDCPWDVTWVSPPAP